MKWIANTAGPYYSPLDTDASLAILHIHLSEIYKTKNISAQCRQFCSSMHTQTTRHSLKNYIKLNAWHVNLVKYN